MFSFPDEVKCRHSPITKQLVYVLRSLSKTISWYPYLCLTQPVEFTKDDAELLFGPDADYKAAFEELDTDEDGEVRENSISATCD